MDLLLTHGYFLDEDPKERAIMKPYAPLGILYLSAYLRDRGFEADVYDATFGSLEELSALLEHGPAAVVGIYGNLMTRRTVLDIIARARAFGWRVVLGGPEPPNYAAEYLEAGADAIVQGEGEKALEELLQVLARGAAGLERIAGIALRGPDGGVVRTAPRPLIPDLDALPWPDRERIDIERYMRVWREHHGVGSLSVVTARGCPYHCRWCSHSTYGKTHRRRSAAAVAKEVEWLLGRYDPDMLWFADDVFTIHRGWMLEYAAEMKRRGLRIPFECITRADRLDGRVADALAELGCFRVWIGSESGSQRILDAMERGVTVGQVQAAVRLCRARGIEAGMFLMWGYEGETLDDIEATVAHVKASMPDQFLTTVSYPIRGTPYYAEVETRLEAPEAWSRTTDRQLEIRGRRPRAFFEEADRLLRAEVAHEKTSAGPLLDPAAADLRREIDRARHALRRMESET